MSRVVILRVGEGSFETGFSVTCQVAEELQRPLAEQVGRLPAAPQLVQLYQTWRSHYWQLGSFTRLEPQPDQVTNISLIESCVEAAQALSHAFNLWLSAPEFRPIQDQLLEQLSPDESIRILLLTNQIQIQKLPWHLWKFLERYPKSEIGFSEPKYEASSSPTLYSDGVKILAIIGDPTGLETQIDQQLLAMLPDAQVKVLIEPSRSEFDTHLWQGGWDILFFAGHSISDPSGTGGHLWLTATTPITIPDLKYALGQALRSGLQLAIFNSCDGLGLARSLTDLQIPQIIVMREPVPDQVARDFLQHFLGAFAHGKSFYLAVREARERLQGLESEFPCATWLPVIVQNPAAIPPTWKSLGGKPSPESQPDQGPASQARISSGDRIEEGTMVTMVWTDLLASTLMKSSLPGQHSADRDQTYFSQILGPHRARVAISIPHYGGQIVKTEGDSFFLVFDRVTAALQWAIDIQKKHVSQPIETPLGPLQLRIGIHTGSPIQSHGDYIGLEVDYLVRLADLAQGAQILLSEVTALLVQNAGFKDLTLHRHNNHFLKGIGDVPVIEALWDQRSPRQPRPDFKAFQEGQPAVQDPEPTQRIPTSSTPPFPVQAPTSQPSTPPPRTPPLRPKGIGQVTSILIASACFSAIALGARWFGGLQATELWGFDRLMQLRPQEKPDHRLLIITVTAQDLLEQSAENRRSSLSDGHFWQLLQRIESFKPRVIGLDIYRDFSVQSQFPKLAAQLRQNSRLIAVCKSRDLESDPTGVAPPPEVPSSRVGFSDFVEDGDGVLRRQVLFMTPDPLSPCLAPYAFATQIALRYLEDQNIAADFTPDQNLKLGQTVFQRLPNMAGGYQPNTTTGGHQMLLNYRALPKPQDIAVQVSVADVLNRKVSPDLVKDRVILIGVSANSSSDFWATPYGAGGARKIPGVLIQAHMVSQLLSTVLDQRPSLWVWPIWADGLWIWVWGSLGGIAIWRSRQLIQGGLIVGAVSLILLLVCLGMLTQGGWLPLVPAILSILGSGGYVIYQRLKTN